MSVALYTIIFLGIAFFVWRNFLKNKELAVGVAQRVCKKHNISLLDETVCLRKISIKREGRPTFYRFYSFDYNVMESFERYRGYVILRNGRLEDVEISDKQQVSPEAKAHTTHSQSAQKSDSANVINFDD